MINYIAAQRQTFFRQGTCLGPYPQPTHSDADPILSCADSYLEGVPQLREVRGEGRPPVQGHSRHGQGKKPSDSPKGCLSSAGEVIQVVPPPEWQPHARDYQQRLQGLVINGPIEQNISGKGGVYECLHIQKKSMTLREYRQKMGVFDKLTDSLAPEEVESMFWKNIVFSPPLYGADLLQSLMDEGCGEWNLNALNSPLREAVDLNIRGVTSSYCYIGSWKTLFCWHKEDLELAAINFLHEGKSKFWYSIPASQGHFLEREAKTYFPEHFSKCPAHLNHKTTLINPYYLKRKYPEMNITKVEHKAGEFMLVLGGAYHCGFNFGVNIAEAINYGTRSWFTQLTSHKVCRCLRSSVKADLTEIYKNLEKSRYATTREFSEFREALFDQIEQEEEQAEKENERRLVKSEFSKKIRKGRSPRRMTLKGETYHIENWGQCEECGTWRKVGFELDEGDPFRCEQAGRRCGAREQMKGQEYITL